MYQRKSHFLAGDNCPNDALGALSTGWYSGINYQPADTYDGKRYDAWGEDYIWLPSIAETGADNVASTTCIWELSSAQRQHNAQSYSWLRSGYYNFYNGAYQLSSTGAYVCNNVSITYGVRPALHFNLSLLTFQVKGA